MHRRVSFVNTEPSEREYFEEYDKFNILTNPWFVLIFILRSLIPFCVEIQLGLFKYRDTVDQYIKVFKLENRSKFDFLLNPKCEQEDEVFQNSTQGTVFREMLNEDCLRNDVIFEMTVFRSIGCSLGAIFGGVLADMFGRMKIALLFAILWTISAWIMASMRNRTMLAICYFILSASCGAVDVVTFVNFGEIANKQNRLLCVYTILTAVFGDILMHYVAEAHVLLWKYFLIFIASTSSFIILACYYIPESPRWLYSKQKQSEAYHQLNEISGTIYHIRVRTYDETKISRRSFWQKLKLVFRRKLKILVVVSLSVIISSVNYHCARMNSVLWHIRNQDARRIIANVGELAGFLFLYPLYIFLGKKYALFAVFICLSVDAIAAIVTLPDYSTAHYSYNAVDILFGTTAICLNWLYTLAAFPTDLRATAQGIMHFIFGVAEAFCIVLVQQQKEMGDFKYYLIFLVIALVGTFVLLLPKHPSTD